MASESPNVFLSIGRPQNDLQREFKAALIEIIKSRGFVPRTVGREKEDSDIPSVRPVDQIKRILSKCDGAIVVAYERHMTTSLMTNSLATRPTEIAPARLPTLWNHAEAAMAYYMGLPILLLREKGVWTDSLLDDGVLGTVGEIEINSRSLVAHDFQGQFSSWAENVHESRKDRPRHKYVAGDPESFTLHDIMAIVGNMTWKTALFLSGALITVLSFAFSAGIWVDHLK